MKRLLLLALILGPLAQAADDYVLIVNVKVKTEKVEAFKTEILSVLDQIHEEPGNLAYVVQQSTKKQTEFAIYEHWESDQAHQDHLALPFMVNYFKKVGPYIEAGYPKREKYFEVRSEDK